MVYWCYAGVTPVLRRCYAGVTSVLRRRYVGVTQVLYQCCASVTLLPALIMLSPPLTLLQCQLNTGVYGTSARTDRRVKNAVSFLV